MLSADYSLGPRAASAGYELKHFNTTPSTNQLALDYSLKQAERTDRKKTALANIWFVADEQTKGRGRRGRVWQSERGNLSASLLVILPQKTSAPEVLGFVAGIALADALCQLLEKKADLIKLKWPNDLLYSGAKMAGILLEAKLLPDGSKAIAVGIGVNVKSTPTGVPYPVSAIGQHDTEISAQMLFGALSDSWVKYFSLWNYGLGRAKVLSRWRELASGIGGPVRVEQHGKIIRGIFTSIDDQGHSIITMANGKTTTITAGDIHFEAVHKT